MKLHSREMDYILILKIQITTSDMDLIFRTQIEPEELQTCISGYNAAILQPQSRCCIREQNLHRKLIRSSPAKALRYHSEIEL